jgi:hypothetical protein
VTDRTTKRSRPSEELVDAGYAEPVSWHEGDVNKLSSASGQDLPGRLTYHT